MRKSTALPAAPESYPAEVPLQVVLTCCTCDLTYTPTAEAVARNRFGCPDPDCGGWTWTATLTVPDGAR